MNELTKTEEKKGILYRVSEDFPEPGVRFIDLTPSLVNTNHRMAILSAMVNHIENEIYFRKKRGQEMKIKLLSQKTRYKSHFILSSRIGMPKN